MAKKIYAVTNYTGCPYITAGKEYEVVNEDGRIFNFLYDDGDITFSRWDNSSHLNGGNWTRIEREVPDSFPQWQLIETAPKDGRKVLLCLIKNGEYDQWPETFGYEQGEWYAVIDGQSLTTKHTHWMPLPPAPQKD